MNVQHMIEKRAEQISLSGGVYNEIIIRYLSDVRQINENFQAYKPYLDEKLKFHRENRN